jgi:hypothetical protein
MKSIHAFSTLLAGRASLPTDPERSHAAAPSKMGAACGRRENAGKISAICALLTVALLQRGFPTHRSGPS